MKNVVARGVLSVVGSLTPPRQSDPKPDPTALLSALPLPVVLLDAENRFRFVNHAAEQFLGISAAQLASQRLTDLVPSDNPLFLLVDQVRRGEATVSDHELTLDGPRLHKPGIAVQGSPLPEEPGAV